MPILRGRSGKASDPDSFIPIKTFSLLTRCQSKDESAGSLTGPNPEKTSGKSSSFFGRVKRAISREVRLSLFLRVMSDKETARTNTRKSTDNE